MRAMLIKMLNFCVLVPPANQISSVTK